MVGVLPERRKSRTPYRAPRKSVLLREVAGLRQSTPEHDDLLPVARRARELGKARAKIEADIALTGAGHDMHARTTRLRRMRDKGFHEPPADPSTPETGRDIDVQVRGIARGPRRQCGKVTDVGKPRGLRGILETADEVPDRLVRAIERNEGVSRIVLEKATQPAIAEGLPHRRISKSFRQAGFEENTIERWAQAIRVWQSCIRHNGGAGRIRC